MKAWKGIVAGILSVFFTVVLFFGLQRLVEPKYADDILEGNFTAEYYEETTPHDVILIGDCEVYENIDPMYLWKNFGITSYIRGNANQLVWQSYYMLEDTLRYETPKAVIFNVQAMIYGEPRREEYNRMALDGMRWSFTKYKAIQASKYGDEKTLDYVFPILRYHQRILELSKSDFTYYFEPKKVAHNGYYMRIDVLPVSESDVADPSWLLGDGKEEETKEESIEDPWADIEVEEDSEDGGDSVSLQLTQRDGTETFGSYPMEYLNRIRTLCEEKGILLIFMKAPSLAPQWYDSDNRQIVDYAAKYNIPYINFYELLEETGIDYETDTYDGGLHMNLSGADKLSEYLGRELVEKYGMEDHRNEPQTAEVYEEKYQFYMEMKEKQQEELDRYGEIRSY